VPRAGVDYVLSRIRLVGGLYDATNNPIVMTFASPGPWGRTPALAELFDEPRTLTVRSPLFAYKVDDKDDGHKRHAKAVAVAVRTCFSGRTRDHARGGVHSHEGPWTEP
jgi:hypothetical protein